ncbi:MAG: hypothetical protein LBQ27_05525 [Clostridiales bacterium]|nr:hypothetical protein [Clostridiales bacterium]
MADKKLNSKLWRRYYVPALVIIIAAILLSALIYLVPKPGGKDIVPPIEQTVAPTIRTVIARTPSPQPLVNALGQPTEITFVAGTGDSNAWQQAFEWSVSADQGKTWEVVRELTDAQRANEFKWKPTKVGAYLIKARMKFQKTDENWAATVQTGYIIGNVGDANKPWMGGYNDPERPVIFQRIDTIDKCTWIDAKKWGIDGNPEHNSAGLNAALWDAYINGMTYVFFPKQMEILVSEYNPVYIQHMQNMTFDFNGATLKINPNKETRSVILQVIDCRNIRITNGTILGDALTHPKINEADTREGNIGILIDRGVVGMRMDNMTVRQTAGWSIITGIGGDYRVASSSPALQVSNLEYGDINADGTKNGNPAAPTGSGHVVGEDAQTGRIRTKELVNVEDFNLYEDKYLMLSYYGYQGNPNLTTKYFDVYYYDEDGNFLTKASPPDVYEYDENLREFVLKTPVQNAPQQIFKKVKFPVPGDGLPSNSPHVKYAHFVVYQAELPTTGHWDYGGAVMNISHKVQGATNSIIENCIIEEAGFYSLAICAGDNFIVRNNTFRNMSTFAVDFEDGWEYMNNIVFESNDFINCSGDITMAAGDNITLIRNNFSGPLYLWPRATNLKIIANNFIKNGANNFIYMQYYSEVEISRNVFDGYNYLNIWRVDPNAAQSWGGHHGWVAGDVKIDDNTFIDTTVMTRNDIYITGKKINPATGFTYTGVEDMTGNNGNTNGVKFTNCTFTSKYDADLYKTKEYKAHIQNNTGISGIFDNCVFDGVIVSFFGGEIKDSIIRNSYINVKDTILNEDFQFINCTVENNNTFTGMTGRLKGMTDPIISVAAFNQGAGVERLTLYAGHDISEYADAIKARLTVVGTKSDGSSYGTITAADYTLSGTLSAEAGTIAEITVTHIATGRKTTFHVIVTAV